MNDEVVANLLSSDQLASGWRTHGLDIVVLQFDPFGSQLVQRGRPDLGPVVPHVPEPLIVGQNEDDVRLRAGGAGRGLLSQQVPRRLLGTSPAAAPGQVAAGEKAEQGQPGQHRRHHPPRAGAARPAAPTVGHPPRRQKNSNEKEINQQKHNKARRPRVGHSPSGFPPGGGHRSHPNFGNFSRCSRCRSRAGGQGPAGGHSTLGPPPAPRRGAAASPSRGRCPWRGEPGRPGTGRGRDGPGRAAPRPPPPALPGRSLPAASAHPRHRPRWLPALGPAGGQGHPGPSSARSPAPPCPTPPQPRLLPLPAPSATLFFPSLSSPLPAPPPLPCPSPASQSRTPHPVRPPAPASPPRRGGLTCPPRSAPSKY